jgi:RNA polymerase sigma-70 factor (ECF subfamily)
VRAAPRPRAYACGSGEGCCERRSGLGFRPEPSPGYMLLFTRIIGIFAGTGVYGMQSERVSDLLDQINLGDEKAFEALVSVAYRELRWIAASLMRGQLDGNTLQPTALVNEAYLRLIQGDHRWENKGHFFGAAARAMRQVLVGHAREKSAQKRMGGATRVTFHDLHVQSSDPGVAVEELDEAMTALAGVDEHLARIMELRYFAGCTVPEIAALTGRSAATVKRDWTYARAWLFEYMNR